LNEVGFVKKLLSEDFVVVKLVIIPLREFIFVYLMPDKTKFVIKGDLNKLLELIEKNFSVVNVEEDGLKFIYEIIKK